MVLKIILFGLIFFVIYKLVGGKLPTFGGQKNDALSKEGKRKIDQDTLVECAKCGTYVTYKESIVVKDTIYCSKECQQSDAEKRG